MKKRLYIAPDMEVVEVKAMTLLADSGVSSDSGIGYSGVDDNGSEDPE